jgi:KaiC/GvpD/RAD55 family RecA-like ATPase
MRVLARAAADKRELLPFRYATGLNVPRGSLVVLLAAPGVGKSFLALNWAWDLVRAGFPVLYHTPDTDYRTQAQRFMALVEDTPIDKVDLQEAAKALQAMTFHLRWSEVSITAESLPDLLIAEQEFLGEAPALTVVDLLADLIPEDGPEAYSTTANALHVTARKFQSTILAVHHTNSNNGTVPPTLNDDRYKAMARRAEVVLGLSQPNPHQLRLDVLKNRAGRHGCTQHLTFQPEKGRVG